MAVAHVEEIEIFRGHRPRALPLPVVLGGPVVVYGWAVKESSGTAPAEVQLWDRSPQGGGFDAIPVTLSAGQSTSDWYGPEGILFEQGLNTVVAVGVVVGSVFVVRPTPR